MQHDGSEGNSSDGVSEDLSEEDYYCICHGPGRLARRCTDAAMAKLNARHAQAAAQREAQNDEGFLDYYVQALWNKDQASSSTDDGVKNEHVCTANFNGMQSGKRTRAKASLKLALFCTWQ